jgi:quercetin dioxygenase-like cupin family protein
VAVRRNPRPTPAPAPTSPDWLLDMVSGLASGLAADPGTSRQLLLTDTYEVWQLAVPAGDGSDWHGHEGLLAAVAVVHGTIEERRRGQASRRLRAGEAVVTGGARPHRLRAVGGPAVAVLAVCPPFRGPLPEATLTPCGPLDRAAEAGRLAPPRAA